MSTEIYYFSGTGNSLYIASELRKRIPGARLIPMVSLLGEDVIKTRGETVGFVFPTHGMIAPIPVRKFLKKVDPGSAAYLFAVATRGGTKFLGFAKLDRILKKKGRRLDSVSVTIVNKEPSREKDTGYVHPSNWFLERLVILGMMYAEFDGVNDYFYSDSKLQKTSTRPMR